MTAEKHRSPHDAVAHHLARAGGLVSITTLVADVLEEDPHLSISTVYSAVWHEVRGGRAEVRVDPSTGIVSVTSRAAVAGESLVLWTLANDPELERIVDRLEERLDEALTSAGAGNMAVQVLALVHDGLVQDLSAGLAYERGQAVAAYVRESGTHPSDVRRRVTAREHPER